MSKPNPEYDPKAQPHPSRVQLALQRLLGPSGWIEEIEANRATDPAFLAKASEPRRAVESPRAHASINRRDQR
jgi:hypothetical protein